MSGEVGRVCVWNVSQVTPPDAIYLRTNPKSPYKEGFAMLHRKERPADIRLVGPDLLRIKPAGESFFKLGADSPRSAMVAVYGSLAWLFDAGEASGEFPEEVPGAGCPVTIYNHGEAGAGQYMELETVSPWQVLTEGKRAQQVVRWSLHTSADEEWTSTSILKLLSR